MSKILEAINDLFCGERCRKWYHNKETEQTTVTIVYWCSRLNGQKFHFSVFFDPCPTKIVEVTFYLGINPLSFHVTSYLSNCFCSDWIILSPRTFWGLGTVKQTWQIHKIVQAVSIRSTVSKMIQLWNSTELADLKKLTSSGRCSAQERMQNRVRENLTAAVAPISIRR